MIRTATALAALCALCACAGPGAPEVARFAEPDPSATDDIIPPGGDPDACYGRDETPATIETVSYDELVTPAELAADGTVITPAVYRSVSQPRIVEERRQIWFQTPCPDEMSPEFIAALQRALTVRGFYAGEASGEVNAETRAAVRAFQLEEGLNSPVLSIAAAKRLGLVAYSRDETVPEQG